MDGSREVAEARWVIGAGGAHSVTRASMLEELAGGTYPGTALVGDVRVRGGPPRDGGSIIATTHGYVRLAPLPEGRWIRFISDLGDDEVSRLRADTSRGAVAASLRRRLGTTVVLEEVEWAATFRMHHRLARRLAGERRFLLGDAGHLSSPFGGEGMNSGLYDACNLGWKLALAVHGHAGPGLLDSFQLERLSADRQVLAVSDRLHALAHAAVESARTGIPTPSPSPDDAVALARSRCMLDVSYADSPLVGEYVAPGAQAAGQPDIGCRYPAGDELAGTRHQVMLFGDADQAGTARLRDRSAGLVDVIRVTGNPRSSAPLIRPPQSSALLIRPDGHVGFRTIPADAAGLEALDAHLSGYLVPDKARRLAARR